MNPITEKFIDESEFALNPPVGSPLRDKPYGVTDREAAPWQIIIPPKDGRPEAKVQSSKSWEDCCEKARRKLKDMEDDYGAGVKLKTDHKRVALKTLAKLAKAGFRTFEDFEACQEMAFLAYLAQKQYEADCAKKNLTCTQSVLQLGQEEARRILTTFQEGKNNFIASIPKGEDPTRTDGHQSVSMGHRLQSLVNFVGPEKPFVQVVTDPKLAEWIQTKLKSENSDWDFSTRAKALPEVQRMFAHVCPPNKFPLPSPEIYPRKVDGSPPPTIAIPPEIVDRVLHNVLKKRPKRLMYLLMQTDFGLRPDEAWKIVQELRKYLGKNYLTVPAHISKTGVLRIILIRPMTRTWLARAPGWLDGRVSNFLEERFQGVNGVKKLQALINKGLRKAGWDTNVPKESIRKCWITGNAKMGVPLELLAVEGGHRLDVLLERYLDPEWTEEQGRAYFSRFLDGKPSHDYTDYELCHAFNQPEP